MFFDAFVVIMDFVKESSKRVERKKFAQAASIFTHNLMSPTMDKGNNENQNNARWGKAPGGRDVVRFLEGPQKRLAEVARAARIFYEFVRGFRALHFVGPCVTVFGSARFTENHEYYRLARALGGELANAGFAVMTGGGPGIMEAANRGAKEMGGRSIGCNIQLPKEQRPNPFLRFHRFAGRIRHTR